MTRAQAEYDARRALERQRGKERAARSTQKFGRVARVEKITGKRCRACPSTAVEYHHIVPRAQMRGDDRLPHPDNAMPLCHTCHQAHHTTVKGRIPRQLLTAGEVRFVLDVKDAAWLDRWYPERAA